MRVVVTGAAGMIGSNLVHGLNAIGVDDVIAVDDLTDGAEVPQPARRRAQRLLRPARLLRPLRRRRARPRSTCVFHEGACSDTMEHDGRLMLDTNYRCSKTLLDACQAQGTRLLYASSAATYGGATAFREEPEFERPLNVYGWSKLLFDKVVRRMLPAATTQVAGFRYFNVYGPREQHKGRMASVAFHHFNQCAGDRPGQAVRRVRRLRARASSAAISSAVERRGRGQLWFLRASGGERHLQPRHRPRTAVQRRRPRRRQRLPRAQPARRRCRSTSWSARAHRVHRLPAGAGRQVPVLHRRPTSTGCAPPAASMRSPTSPAASPTTSPGCSARPEQAGPAGGARRWDNGGRPCSLFERAARIGRVPPARRHCGDCQSHLRELRMFKQVIVALGALVAATAFAAVDVNKASQAELEVDQGHRPDDLDADPRRAQEGAVQGLERPDHARQGRGRRRRRQVLAERPHRQRHAFRPPQPVRQARRRRPRREEGGRRGRRRRSSLQRPRRAALAARRAPLACELPRRPAEEARAPRRGAPACRARRARSARACTALRTAGSSPAPRRARRRPGRDTPMPRSIARIGTRQARQVLGGDVVEALARRDHQHLDRLQAGVGARLAAAAAPACG